MRPQRNEENWARARRLSKVIPRRSGDMRERFGGVVGGGESAVVVIVRGSCAFLEERFLRVKVSG